MHHADEGEADDEANKQAYPKKKKNKVETALIVCYPVKSKIDNSRLSKYDSYKYRICVDIYR